MSAIAHRHTAFVSSAFARAPSDDARVRRQLACSAPTARVSRLSRGFSSRAPRARPATDTTASTSSARVIWFRIGDLRTHDHPALTAAASDPSTPVLPVFVFDPAEARHMTPGALRAAHESVSDLRANLRAAGLDLIVRIGDPIAILLELAASVDAASIAVAEELEWCRAHAARAVDAALQSRDVVVDRWSLRLREPTDEGEAAAAAAVETARAEKSAPVVPYATDAAWVASRGATASPTPSPSSYPGGLAANVDAGEMPSVDDVRAMAGLPDGEFDAAYDAAMEAAVAALNDPEFTRRRKRVSATDTAFVMLREEKMLALAAEERSATIPAVPFRLPGGETAALEFLDAYLDFYTATGNREHQRLYDRVLEVGKPNAFFVIFGDALRLGTLSPRTLFATCQRWEQTSKRATDLCAIARNIATARDYQAEVAASAMRCGVEGPGVPLVGAYNVNSGDL